MNMCRHLSSAFTALNYQISGMNPVGYVLHSILWYLVIIVLMGFLARRIVPGSGAGANHPVSFITVIIFALAEINPHQKAIFLNGICGYKLSGSIAFSS